MRIKTGNNFKKPAKRGLSLTSFNVFDRCTNTIFLK